MTDNELVQKMAKRVNELVPTLNHEFNLMIARICHVIVMEFLATERVKPAPSPHIVPLRDPIFVIDVFHAAPPHDPQQVSQAVALNRESAKSVLHHIMQTNPSHVAVSMADLGAPYILTSNADVDAYLPEAKDMS